MTPHRASHATATGDGAKCALAPSAWIEATLDKSYPYYLANRAQSSKLTLAVYDKYTGKVATRAVPDAKAVEKVIAAVDKATTPMRRFTPWAHPAVLQHCAQRLTERRDELADALCIEAGKPIKDSAGEVTRLIETFRVAAAEAARINGAKVFAARSKT